MRVPSYAPTASSLTSKDAICIQNRNDGALRGFRGEKGVGGMGASPNYLDGGGEGGRRLQRCWLVSVCGYSVLKERILLIERRGSVGVFVAPQMPQDQAPDDGSSKVHGEGSPPTTTTRKEKVVAAPKGLMWRWRRPVATLGAPCKL